MRTLPRPTTCDERICIRLPRTLRDHILEECHRTARTTSDIVRQSLVEHLSPKELTR